jgi:Spy/CpxP family protein refolding chaperone
MSGQTKTDHSAHAGHQSCLDAERESLARGEGFGMALPADHAGFPGPRHVLDLGKELKLSSEQVRDMQKLFEGMKERAQQRAAEIQSAKELLEKMFRENRPEADLREQSFRLDSIYAELRWIHLSSHLAARKLLTAEQVAAYQRLRAPHSPGN